MPGGKRDVLVLWPPYGAPRVNGLLLPETRIRILDGTAPRARRVASRCEGHLSPQVRAC